MAEADLGNILEDDLTGWGWAIELTNPSSKTETLTGYSNDISQVVDPDTGVVVSGRSASISIRIQSLYDKGLEIPRGIVDSSSKPWIVKFDDINGVAYTFKVAESNPDRALGVVTCVLEAYSDT